MMESAYVGQNGIFVRIYVPRNAKALNVHIVPSEGISHQIKNQVQLLRT